MTTTGPDSPPFAIANAASSQIRELNRRTFDPRACTLDDVYAVLGSLGEMTERLQQTTSQLEEVLAARLAAGGLRIDASEGVTVAAVVQACRADLSAARHTAAQLTALVSSTHRGVASLADIATIATIARSSSSHPHARRAQQQPRPQPGRSL